MICSLTLELNGDLGASLGGVLISDPQGVGHKWWCAGKTVVWMAQHSYLAQMKSGGYLLGTYQSNYGGCVFARPAHCVAGAEIF
ncbi:unnamed protein product [Brassica oleracea]